MEFFCATTAKQAFIFAGSTIFHLGTLSEAEKGHYPTVRLYLFVSLCL